MSWVFRDEYLPARAHQIGACDDSNDFAPPHNRQPLDVMTLHQLDRHVQGRSSCGRDDLVSHYFCHLEPMSAGVGGCRFTGPDASFQHKLQCLADTRLW